MHQFDRVEILVFLILNPTRSWYGFLKIIQFYRNKKQALECFLMGQEQGEQQ